LLRHVILAGDGGAKLAVHVSMYRNVAGLVQRLPKLNLHVKRPHNWRDAATTDPVNYTKTALAAVENVSNMPVPERGPDRRAWALLVRASAIWTLVGPLQGNRVSHVSRVNRVAGYRMSETYE
jgi:hypothetical protein